MEFLSARGVDQDISFKGDTLVVSTAGGGKNALCTHIVPTRFSNDVSYCPHAHIQQHKRTSRGSILCE